MSNMADNLLTVTGMVIKDEPIGEFDRRVVIITKEKGKISVFAKGARRQNSTLAASTNPFAFGRFTLFAGRNSYSLREAFIDNFFEGMRSDITMAFYGMYENKYSPGVVKAVSYIIESPVNKVFSFKLSEESENELIAWAKEVSEFTFDKKFTSLELIE